MKLYVGDILAGRYWDGLQVLLRIEAVSANRYGCLQAQANGQVRRVILHYEDDRLMTDAGRLVDLRNAVSCFSPSCLVACGRDDDCRLHLDLAMECATQRVREAA